MIDNDIWKCMMHDGLLPNCPIDHQYVGKIGTRLLLLMLINFKQRVPGFSVLIIDSAMPHDNTVHRKCK